MQQIQMIALVGECKFQFYIIFPLLGVLTQVMTFSSRVKK